MPTPPAPSANDTHVTIEQMFTLAKRLRTRAYWTNDGYYSTEAEGTANSAKRAVFEEIAGEIDDLFEFDSSLTQEDRKR